MKKLFIVSQLFQFMVATQIKTTIFSNESADILINNAYGSSVGLKELSINISRSYKDVWDNVIYFEFDKFKLPSKNLNFIQKVKKSVNEIRYIFFPDKFLKVIELTKKYDMILGNRLNFVELLIALKYNALCNANFFFFEEGAGSYLYPFYNEYAANLIGKIKTKALNLNQKLKGHLHIEDIVKGLYYFEPNNICYDVAYPVFNIPRFELNDNKLKEYFLNSFDFPDENDLDKKFIFFEENLLTDEIDDFKLIMKIAEIVGKDNLVIKLHPRRTKDRFSTHGIKVSKASTTPWEALMMKYDYSDKVILTISSNIAFSSRLYFSCPIKTYMLYNLFDIINPVLDSTTFPQYIECFKENYGDENFIIPANREEFYLTLKND